MNTMLFVIFGIATLACWVLASALSWFRLRHAACWLFSIGIALLGAYIAYEWANLHRPPLRTTGEIRMWYALFLSLIGFLIAMRSAYKWVLPLTTLLAGVFVCLDLLVPQAFDRSLMPALRSAWFVPHVTVYIFAYALLSVATLMALFSMLRPLRFRLQATQMQLVRIGWALLSMGMVMGSLWAKQAWGTFWSWDPKETWAAITWQAYLLYMHYAPFLRKGKWHFIWLLIAFLMLQMCWYGINLLPAAQGSIHVYG